MSDERIKQNWTKKQQKEFLKKFELDPIETVFKHDFTLEQNDEDLLKKPYKKFEFKVEVGEKKTEI